MELIQILTLESIWSTTKECVQKQISNDKMTSNLNKNIL